MRVFDLLFKQYTSHKLEDCLNYKVNGKWLKFSTSKVIAISSRIAMTLLDKGIKKGDRVGLVSENRPEWNFIDLACQQIGAVLVPMYPNIGSKDYRYIISEAEIKLMFVSNKDILSKVQDATEKLDVDIYTFNKISGQENWKTLLEASASRDINELKPHRAQVGKDDLLTIIYTSGTTGNPKGVMLTHNNVVSSAKSLVKNSTLEPGERALSFLPLNHVFERTLVYTYMYLSVAVYYAESLETIGDNLKELKPQTFNTVPRLLEKVYDKIIKKSNELSGIKKGIFNWAINLGLKYDPGQDMGVIYKKQLDVARKLVFSKWQEALGGNIKQIGCGAASLQDRLARVFWAADIKILEGYGLTETSPVVTSSAVDSYRVGCVGNVVDGVEIKLGEDGEVLVKGPNVMKGYYKKPDLTAEVIQDGWLKTGDIGVIEDGFLRITDRKKEMFKTSGGKYVAPQLLENRFKQSQFIEQIMVVGEGEKMPAALIQPNFEYLYDWAKEHNITWGENSDIILNAEVISCFQQEVDMANEDFAKWEKVKQFRLTPDVWSVDDGHLTPTMKLRRKIVKEMYLDLYDNIYGR